MASNHRYELLKEGEEIKEDLKNEPLYTSTPAVKSWWKFLLSNLFAACVGAAVMFFVVNMFSARPYNDKVEVSAAASTNSSAEVEIPYPVPKATRRGNPRTEYVTRHDSRLRVQR